MIGLIAMVLVGVSLDSIQGVWWSDCSDPAAAFVISGSEYYGDFVGQHPLQLADNVLVFEHGLVDGHSTDVTHEPLSFEVLVAEPEKLVLRPTPGNPYAGDWGLVSCR